MFNGMMDPELIRMAQEQMSRMSPTELARLQQQMMSNPELVKMASESMNSLRPEDFKFAAEQLKNTRPEEMAEISKKMANASPEELAAMRSRLDAQVSYEMSAAETLKKQGNELHSLGRFRDAAQKYLLAKKNLKGIPVTKCRTLLLACSLNLMSCYLKSQQYNECISEGTEVLAYDARNVKALYRRGQAYKEQGLLQDALSDLSKAHKVSPEDETIADVLRDVKERMTEEGGNSRGLRIEEIIEEEPPVLSEANESYLKDHSKSWPEENGGSSVSQNGIGIQPPLTNVESLQALKDDPDSIRSFQDFISRTDPETMAALAGGNAENIPPNMVKTASNIIGKMSPEELQRMIQLASSFQGENPLLSRDVNSSNAGPIPREMSPGMLKTASDIMSKISSEDLQRMFEVASSLKGKEKTVPVAAGHSNSSRSDDLSKNDDMGHNSTGSSRQVGESCSSQDFFNLRSAASSSLSSSNTDLQEQMRNQMKDPAMRQMFSSMVKNMSPEMMANMSEQFGIKLSREDAEKAQQAMSSLSPEDLERMMKWADRVQKGVEGAKKAKNWLLGRPGMILAIVMLLLAVFLHWLGYIGR